MRSLALPLLALVLAACGEGGAGDRPARPDELSLRIVRGESQTGGVRPATSVAPGVAAQVSGNPELLPDPVVVRVSVAGASASVSGSGLTGPSMATTIPAGTIVNWRVIGEGCGAPFALVTAIAASDSVVNFWRRGTKAGIDCQMVAEGIAGSVPFGSDTAHAEFAPGAPSRTYMFDRSVYGTTAVIDPRAVQDIYGNPIPFRVVPDAYLSVGDTACCTEASRAVTFTRPAKFIEATTDLVLADGTVAGRLRYQLSNGIDYIGYLAHGLDR